MAEHPPVPEKGRQVVEGRLEVIRGTLKRGVNLPRRITDFYPDHHCIWLGDAEPPRPPWPLLKYRGVRTIEGLTRACHGHRVRVTCTVGAMWRNGLGAYIIRAQGECLEPDEHVLAALGAPPSHLPVKGRVR